jgi:hypothetical protein
MRTSAYGFDAESAGASEESPTRATAKYLIVAAVLKVAHCAVQFSVGAGR